MERSTAPTLSAHSGGSMTDAQAALAQVREALAAGPTPGEWSCYDDSNDGKTSRIEIVAIGKTVARIYRSVPEQDLPNARLIAACSPANIAAILAHVEAQKAEIERLTAERDELRRQLDPMGEYASADELIAALRAEKAEDEAMKLDAQRYRWLRPRFFAADFAYSDPPVCAIVFRWPESAKISANLDREIDAAMGASNE